MNDYYFDYIIIGYGLAGSVLSSMLIDEGYNVLVIDKFFPNSSSQVAAGLVNPITGRRVVKSWMVDELIPFAESYYKKQEEKSDLKFYNSMDVLEVIHNVKDLNEWTSRTEDQGMHNYLGKDSPEEIYRGKITDFKKMIRITSSGWMNIPLFIEFNRNKLLETSSILEEEFDHSSLIIKPTEIEYGKFKSRNIIFCEGYGAVNNPLWKQIPFLPAKGEIIMIECKSLPQDFILMSGIFMIPLGKNKFRVGSTYEWNFKDSYPTDSGKEKLKKSLEDFLKVPFEIMDHTAGIRPTIKDRRPVIGNHKNYENVFVFNGLGTKGVLLAPFFSDHFIKAISGKEKLMADVDVRRFD